MCVVRCLHAMRVVFAVLCVVFDSCNVMRVVSCVLCALPVVCRVLFILHYALRVNMMCVSVVRVMYDVCMMYVVYDMHGMPYVILYGVRVLCEKEHGI